MDEYFGMNWFAIQVKRFRESLAAANIAETGVEVFLPMVMVEHPEECVIKAASKPLFPGYFFARFNPGISLGLIEGARGVLRVVKSGSTPVSVDDPVVKEIQDLVEKNGLIRLAHREFREGDRVAIQAGPFEGMLGRVQAELDDHRRVAILLEALWSARVVIERRWVEAEAV